MNKKILVLICVAGCLFVITAVMAVILAGKLEIKGSGANTAQIGKAESKNGQNKNNGVALIQTKELPPDNIQKEYEPPIEGPLLN